jgi:hypothetical protein
MGLESENPGSDDVTGVQLGVLAPPPVAPGTAASQSRPRACGAAGCRAWTRPLRRFALRPCVRRKGWEGGSARDVETRHVCLYEDKYKMLCENWAIKDIVCSSMSGGHEYRSYTPSSSIWRSCLSCDIRSRELDYCPSLRCAHL